VARFELNERVACSEYILYAAHMTQITIRQIDDTVRLKLKMRAAAKGRSLEAELRDIISQAANELPVTQNIGRSIFARFQRLGGVELDIPPRSAERKHPEFSS